MCIDIIELMITVDERSVVLRHSSPAERREAGTACVQSVKGLWR